jgi:hypothetical protein
MAFCARPSAFAVVADLAAGIGIDDNRAARAARDEVRQGILLWRFVVE